MRKLKNKLLRKLLTRVVPTLTIILFVTSAFTTPFFPIKSNQAASITGPLRVLSSNPRYFTDGSGKAILLSGSHTWSNFQDNGGGFPPATFDYTAYLNFLVNNHHNFFRLWTWEQSRWTLETTDDNYWFNPMGPYQRTGPGNALDGKLKYDLTKFDQTYFDRMRSRIIQAGNSGIYVSIMLFNGWSVANNKGGYAKNNPWKGHPFNSSNNINSINGDPNNHNNGLNTQDLSIPAITAIQDAYVKKVIDTVNDLVNVLYEIDNEGDGTSVDWQKHMIDLIHTYENGKMKHPVGMTVTYPGGYNPDLFTSAADWISPNNNGNYYFDPPASDGTKVILNDTDHLCGICYDHTWVWKSFTRGLNPIYMDGYDGAGYGVGATGFNKNDPELPYVRSSLGYTRAYANRMNLAAMTPHGELTSTGYALANLSAGASELLIYQPNSGSFTLNLSAVSGTLNVEWFDPSTGQATASNPVSGGATRSFTPPFSGDAVLYLSQVVTRTPTATFTKTFTATAAAPTPTNTRTPIPSATSPTNRTSTPTSTRTATATLTPSLTPSAIPRIGLVAAYNFNEGTGNAVRDSSGNSNNGTVSSPTWVTSGKYGSALAFGTSAARVIVPDANSLDLTTGMTLEAWVYPTSGLIGGAWETILMKEQTNEFVYTLYANGSGNQPYGMIYSSGAERETGGGGTLTLNTWTHLAVTYNGSVIRLYKNGVQISSFSYNGTILTSTGSLSIGGNSIWTNETFTGRIDEVRIYNRALSNTEIQADMNSPVP